MRGVRRGACDVGVQGISSFAGGGLGRSFYELRMRTVDDRKKDRTFDPFGRQIAEVRMKSLNSEEIMVMKSCSSRLKTACNSAT